MIAPWFIDWTAYRADFEREASRILGHPVTVRGEASARLLPFPSVTFGDVVVADGTQGGKPLMNIGKFRMDAELAPYLSGEIRIFSMRLEQPSLRVPLGSDGRLAFAGSHSSLPTRATVVLEDVEIVGGSVAVENGLTGRVHTFASVEGRFSAKSLTGPFAGAGTLTADGTPLAFTLSSGPVQPETGLPFKLTVDSRNLDSSVVFDGSVSLAGLKPTLAGKLQVTSPLPVVLPKPAEPFATADKAPIRHEVPRAKLLPPFSLTSAVSATASAVTLTDMRVAAGAGEVPYILTGTGSIGLARLPHFELDLKGEQVDVDKLAAEPDASPTAVTFDQRLEAARAVFAVVPKPTMPGTVRIALPIVVAGDTTIRDVAFTVSPTDTGWSVERLEAELPGRTRMEASGVVTLDEAIGFKGDLLVASRQPSGFAGWLTGAVDPAIRALPQAGFSAKVDLSRSAQRLDDLEVDVGGDTLRGSLSRTGPREDRTMVAEVTAGRMDLDALLALSRLFTGEEDTLAEAERLSLKIQAGPATYAGATAARLDADLGYDGSRVEIRRLLLGDVDGANVTVSGELGGFGGDVDGRLNVALDAADPERLVEALAQRLPASPALDALRARAPALGPLALRGEVKTVAEAADEKPTLEADLTGSAAATDITLQLALGNGIYSGGESGRFGLELQLASDAPAALLGQLGLETLPVPAPSPLTVQLSLSAGATGPVAATAMMRAPGTSLDVKGTLDVATDGIKAADLGLTAKSDDLGPWLLTTGVALGQSQLETLPLDLSGQFGWDGEALALRVLTGSVAGASVNAELEKPRDGPASGNVFVSSLSLPWLASLVYGHAPEGDSWPAENFGAPLLPPIDVALALTSERLQLTPEQSVENFSATLAGTDGQIRLDDLKGAIAGGFVQGTATLRNAAGIGGFALQAEFEGIDVGALALAARDSATAAEGSAPPAGESASGDETAAGDAAVTGTIDATVKLDGTGQSYQALVASLTGAGSITLGDASFAGIRPGKFAGILKAADAEGFVPGADTAGRVVAGLDAGARFPVPQARTDFAVTAGVARFAATTLRGAGETLSGDGALDLRQMSVSGDLRLDIAAGDDAVEGATPSILYRLSGPLAAPQLTADVQPLASFLSVRAYEREQARVEAMQEALQERLRLRREARYYRWREVERLASAQADAAAAAVEQLRLRRGLEQAAAARAAAEAEAREAIARQEAAARQAEADRLAAERAAADRAAAETAAAAKAAAAKAAAEEAAAEKAAAERAEAGRRAAQRESERRAAEAARADAAAEAAERAARERETAPAAADGPAPARGAVPRLDLPPVTPVPPADDQPEFPSLPGVSDPLKF